MGTNLIYAHWLFIHCLSSIIKLSHLNSTCQRIHWTQLQPLAHASHTPMRRLPLQSQPANIYHRCQARPSPASSPHNLRNVGKYLCGWPQTVWPTSSRWNASYPHSPVGPSIASGLLLVRCALSCYLAILALASFEFYWVCSQFLWLRLGSSWAWAWWLMNAVDAVVLLLVLLTPVLCNSINCWLKTCSCAESWCQTAAALSAS